MGKNIVKNISKSLSGKYSPGLLAMRHNRLYHAIQCATYAFKTTLKRVIQKITEATVDLIGNKTSNKITKISKNSKQNDWEW